MTDLVHLIERVAGRNPVPDLDDPPAGAWSLDVVRSAVTERDTDMMTDQPSTETPKPVVRRRAGWRVAIAAFAIVLLAGGGLWFAARSSDTDNVAEGLPTTNAPESEAERIALDTMVAYVTFDEEAFLAASTARAEVAEFFLWNLRMEQASNGIAESITCRASDTANTTVNCVVLSRSDLTDVFELGTTRVNWKVTTGDGGWVVLNAEPLDETPIFTEWNPPPELFGPDGPCGDGPDAGPEACAAAFIENAQRWVAEN